MIDWWNSVTGRQPEDEDPVTRALRFLGAAPEPEQPPPQPAAGSGQPSFAPEDYSSNVIAPPMPQETAAAPFQDTFTPDVGAADIRGAAPPVTPPQSPLEAPTAARDQVTRYVPSYAPQAAQVTAPEPPAERPYWRPTETESAAVGAGIDATLAAEPAGPDWLPGPVRTAAGAGLGALQTVQAADQAVRARIDPRVWVFARDGIARTELPPGMWERYNELAGAADPATGQGKTELTPDERAEYDAIRQEVEARYRQIKDDPDALTRYANASPGYGVTSAATDLALSPAAGSAAAGIARPAAAALGAGPRAVRAAGYAADVAGQSLVDPTSLPFQPAADALLTGVRAVPGALRRAMADNARRVAAADARMAVEGSTRLPAMFGAVPDPRRGVPTVEVIQEQLDAARAAVDQARATGDLATAHAATEHVWALTDQLADALNARRALEPAIASDVGRQANPLTLTEESAADFNRAVRPQDLVSPEDAANLGGPASVPRPSISLNATPGAVPAAPGSGPLASVNRALSEGIAGGVGGAVIEQGRNPDEDPRTAAARGFAAGAVGFPVATRLARGAARLAGAAPSPSGGAMGTLGAIPGPGDLGRLASRFVGLEGAISKAQQRAASRAAAGLPTPSPWTWMKQAGYAGIYGPATFVSNVAGGLQEATLGNVKELVRSRVEGTSFRRQLRAQARAVPEGLAGLGRVLAPDSSAATAAVSGGSQGTASLSERVANPVAYGAARILERPGELLTEAPDAVFRPAFVAQGMEREASRIAREMGLRGQKAESYADSLMQTAEQLRANPGTRSTSAEARRVVAAGTAYADELGYKGPPGKLGSYLADLSKRDDAVGVLASFLLPFPGMASRMSTAAARSTPGVGLLPGVGRGRPRFDVVYDQAFGTLAAAGIASWAFQGGITGSGPDDPEKRKELQDLGWQPNSTLVGGYYVPNRVFGRFQPMLDAAGEIHDTLAYGKQDRDTSALVAQLVKRGTKIAVDQTGLSGLADLHEMLTQNFESQFPGFAARSAQRYLPFGGILRAAAAASDPYARRPDRGDYLQAAAVGLPGLRQGVPAAQGALGRPSPNPQQGLGAFVPRVTSERDDPIVRTYLDAGVDIGQPRREIAEDGVKIDLSPAETRRWNELRGEELAQRTQRLIDNGVLDRLPADRRRERLEGIRADAAERADERLRREIGGSEFSRRRREAAQKAKAG